MFKNRTLIPTETSDGNFEMKIVLPIKDDRRLSKREFEDFIFRTIHESESIRVYSQSENFRSFMVEVNWGHKNEERYTTHFDKKYFLDLMENGYIVTSSEDIPIITTAGHVYWKLPLLGWFLNNQVISLIVGLAGIASFVVTVIIWVLSLYGL